MLLFKLKIKNRKKSIKFYCDELLEKPNHYHCVDNNYDTVYDLEGIQQVFNWFPGRPEMVKVIIPHSTEITKEMEALFTKMQNLGKVKIIHKKQYKEDTI
jgi:hypothetical protein